MLRQCTLRLMWFKLRSGPTLIFWSKLKEILEFRFLAQPASGPYGNIGCYMSGHNRSQQLEVERLTFAIP